MTNLLVHVLLSTHTWIFSIYNSRTFQFPLAKSIIQALLEMFYSGCTSPVHNLWFRIQLSNNEWKLGSEREKHCFLKWWMLPAHIVSIWKQINKTLKHFPKVLKCWALKTKENRQIYFLNIRDHISTITAQEKEQHQKMDWKRFSGVL